ncbi:hypothetical protein HID58_017160 [Brassica napus]|uniref:Uncharacterized protein n=1 Tax=Brassica napus TaxID=3708 RepID=A0ABQ8D6A9_BRANA|nr:hypothetical protein HID58_017160 [Brassica napus]
MAKEKQPLMDLEQGIKLTSFTDNEPPKMILDKTNITGSGYVTKWSEGSRGPWDAPYQIATLGEVEESQKQKAIEDPTMENVTGTDNVEYCCIYRVPNWLRRVNPEAYTPQMLLLGPLQHSKKAEALELSKTDLRYMNYMNMERHKKKYLMEIAHRYGTETIIEFSRIIERDEHIIRASYAESTEWIKSAEFVEMIVRDAVFLLGFFLQTGTQKYQRNEDILVWYTFRTQDFRKLNKSRLVDFGSYYEPIAEKLKKHYNSSLHRSVATLRRVYFKDIWTGTATVAAVVLLILALVQTVASVLQVTQSDPKSPPPQAPPRGKFSEAPHISMERLDIQVNLDLKMQPSKFLPKRVPCRLRNVRPDAYTPQMLLIGPLSKKPQIMELSKNDSRHLEYEKMEQHKKKYLENFALMYGNQTVEEFIRIIVRDEQIISSEDFVEMMLVDSVFILVFLKQTGRRYIDKTGYFLFDESCHRDTIFEDLLLLENQLPFSLLENLFGPFFIKFGDNLTFRDFILGNFGFINKIKPEVNFIHITDMFRCVRVEKLGLTKKDQIYEQYSKKFLIKNLHNADELDSAGVDIVGNKVERGTSFAIKFERARGHTERLWRNIMALEQCHYTYAAYVCHYIAFLDFLIDTEQDVELLVNKGVIKNLLGHSESVVEMVNKMCLGLADNGFYYYDIAERLNKYYDNRLNRFLATLRRVYFKDLWTGTATIAAVIILVLTLIGTVTSVLQVTQDDSDPTKSLLPPPPSRDL